MSPKINIGPMIDSEKFHEKSRNSLWEAFMTSKENSNSKDNNKEKAKSSKSPSVSPKNNVLSPKSKPEEGKGDDALDQTK